MKNLQRNAAREITGVKVSTQLK